MAVLLNFSPNNVEIKKLTHPIRQIIFDCDGVLVDSEILASQTVLAMLEPYGFVMNLTEYNEQFAGKVEEDTLAIVQKEYHIDLPDDFLAQLRLEIERRLDHELQPVPGMKETVASISFPKAIVSNSRLARVLSSLKTTGLDQLFGDDIFAAEMVERPKPAPDVYLYAARQLDRKPEECLVVEDSRSGMVAARQAGMPVIGFLGASHLPPNQREVAQEVGAWTTVANAQELHELLDKVDKGFYC